MRRVAELFESGENIMQVLRDEGCLTNSSEAIQISYDLQAGSYTAFADDPARAEHRQRYLSSITDVIRSLSPRSLFEAGVGEATTLAPLTSALRDDDPPVGRVVGLDISMSRLGYARRYLDRYGLEATLLVGDLQRIPVVDSCFDVVLTVHAVEPNRGREREILKELHRVAGRYLVLFEPSNELGSAATRLRMDTHRYCQDLGRHCKELGLKVIEHRLFEYPTNPENETAVLIVEKSDSNPPSHEGQDFLACPRCVGHPLARCGRESLYCTSCLSAYPVLFGIPQLLEENAVLVTRYGELGDVFSCDRDQQLAD